MATTVRFVYESGLPALRFAGATLVGGWDAHGRPSGGAWRSAPMSREIGDDGCVAFTAEVDLEPGDFSWGVWLDDEDGGRAWGITSEVDELSRTAQERRLTLDGSRDGPHVERYRLSSHRALGARPVRGRDGAPDGVRFTVWAPNARAVDVVFGGESGYIADDGEGAGATLPLEPHDGLWTGRDSAAEAPAGARYMYRITRDDGQVAYRTDMYSRLQAGSGDVDPQGRHYTGPVEALDGTPSCSVVVDPEGDATTFWDGEHDPARPVPDRLEDLVVYELHVGALNPATTSTGTLADAVELLPYLEELGVTAVELLPMFEFNGSRAWGYGSSQFLAVESSAGGPDALKRFVKACHQRGIAVIADVVYNHYDGDSERASWQYDSRDPARNIYLWYEGAPDDYPQPDGGYVDNESSGWAPRYSDEQVRQLFVSSAVMLVDEFHMDGLRVDQTGSMHAYNRLHADGREASAANVWGRKQLRQLCQTVKLVRPQAMLIAEDHTDWDAVTEPAEAGGLGFDATWFVRFYHDLIGDKDEGPGAARLLYAAARDHTGPLAMGAFGRTLAATGRRKVVYHESHDEAGNAEDSSRTIVVAVDGAPLVGETRRFAEARCRFAFGVSALSAGTPMFLMGEEVGAGKAYRYDRFAEDKEDLHGLRSGSGAGLFGFYRDLIALRRATPALRSRNIEIVATSDDARLLAFRRVDEAGDYLVVASLAERPYDTPGYRLQHESLGESGWLERFNSDAAAYGGWNVGNRHATVPAHGGSLEVVVPACGFVVFERVRG